MPRRVVDLLACWQGCFGRHHHSVIWKWNIFGVLRGRNIVWKKWNNSSLNLFLSGCWLHEVFLVQRFYNFLIFVLLRCTRECTSCIPRCTYFFLTWLSIKFLLLIKIYIYIFYRIRIGTRWLPMWPQVNKLEGLSEMRQSRPSKSCNICRSYVCQESKKRKEQKEKQSKNRVMEPHVHSKILIDNTPLWLGMVPAVL